GPGWRGCRRNYSTVPGRANRTPERGATGPARAAAPMRRCERERGRLAARRRALDDLAPHRDGPSPTVHGEPRPTPAPSLASSHRSPTMRRSSRTVFVLAALASPCATLAAQGVV